MVSYITSLKKKAQRLLSSPKEQDHHEHHDVQEHGPLAQLHSFQNKSFCSKNTGKTSFLVITSTTFTWI